MTNSPPDGLTPAEVAELKELARQGILPALRSAAKESTSPYYWYDSRAEQGARMLGGGTMCVVDTGERLIGVTNQHIHSQALAAWVDPDLALQVGSHSFDPTARLIDVDGSVDLATCALSDVQIAAMRVFPHHALQWPPPQPALGDLLLVGGWPWRMVEEDVHKSHHDFLNFIGRANVVSERHVGMRTYTSSSVPWGGRALPPGTNLGGMSGGPVYRIDLDSMVPLTFVGIIYEYSPGFEQVFSVPLRRVRADGSIERSL